MTETRVKSVFEIEADRLVGELKVKVSDTHVQNYHIDVEGKLVSGNIRPLYTPLEKQLWDLLVEARVGQEALRTLAVDLYNAGTGHHVSSLNGIVNAAEEVKQLRANSS